MKIEKIRIFEGRNIYSHKKCIRMNLDLEGYSETPSKDIQGFNEKLLNYIPQLREHCCCIGRKGGFVERLNEGTYLSHICEHSIIALENILGMDVKYGKARVIEGEKYYIIYQYEFEKSAIECGKIAVDLINSIINKSNFNLKERLSEAGYILRNEKLGPSTEAIITEAKKRKIPVLKISDESMFQLGYGKNGQRIEATICEDTKTVAVDIACDKLLCKNVLYNQCIPVSQGYKVKNYIDLLFKAEKIGYPLVLKPRFGNQGKGVYVNLKNQKELINAYGNLSKKYSEIIVEKFIQGRDYRICIVDGKVIAAAKRVPPYIVGNGNNTIYELISKINKDNRRGIGHERPLTKIKIDRELKNNIYKQGYNLNSVIPKCKKVLLRQNANLSTGGISIDCTDSLCEDIKDISIRAAKTVGLNICGIDICCKDITKPLKGQGVVIEVNAAPGIRMHEYPFKGKSRNVAKAIVDMMFKEKSATIPIISITGTNGKTTTTRLIGHVLSEAGKIVGMTTTGGIYLDNKCIEKGDTTGYDSAMTILTNTETEVAVLELARGGLIRAGIPYDLSDVGVITNITEDHLGLDEINTMDDMAYVKALVGECVKDDGYVVINADNKYCVDIINRMKSKKVLFSKNKNNTVLKKYLKEDNIIIYSDKNNIVMKKNDKTENIINVKDVPITLNGILEYNVENTMAAIGALIGMGVNLNIIKNGLKTFSGDENENPGRFNMYDVNGVNVILDYGHNIDGYKSVLSSIKKLKHNNIIGVIGVPGDRTDESTLKVAKLCAQNLDYIYIKEDRDRRGRNPFEVANVLEKGILKCNYDKKKIYKIINEEEALKKAIEDAKSGDIVVMFFEEFEPAVKVIKDKIQSKNKASIALA